MAFPGHRLISKPDGSTGDAWQTYICGHCNTKVSGGVVAYWRNSSTDRIFWVLCPNCECGSVIHNDNVLPSICFGPKIEGLPSEVDSAYEEARRCLSLNAFTACELICRKILMHIAVDKGASEGDSFASYIGFIEGQGYITPPMKGWVDMIRRNGNNSTHKLIPPEKERAEGTLMFTAELLRLVYEMDTIAKKYMKNP